MPHELPDTKNLKATCSFCKKELSEVRSMVSGFGAMVCDECVQLCNEMFSHPNDDPDECVLLNKMQVSKFVSVKLGQLIMPKHITRCEFSITSPGGGGAPILHVRGSGKHDDGRDFYFDLRSRVWGNEHGLVMNHLAELEAEWE
jgi:hypothetical protein